MIRAARPFIFPQIPLGGARSAGGERPPSTAGHP